jgi:anti-sigma regulatory factor (Ser/Thr protein kinase)
MGQVTPVRERRPGAGLSLVESEDMEWFRDGDALPAAARGTASALARRLGFVEPRVSEVALAVTEAATNLRRHAVDGALLLRVLRAGDRVGLEFVTVDCGPGMDDVSAYLQDGVSSAGTLGIGLGVIARCADTFDLHSLPGRGSVLAARFWNRRAESTAPAGRAAPEPDAPAAGGPFAPASRAAAGTGPDGGPASASEPPEAGTPAPGTAVRDTAASGTAASGAPQRVGAAAALAAPAPAADPGPLPAEACVAGLTRPISGETVSGDAWAARLDSPADGGEPALLVFFCDGLGHGPLAAAASRAAVTAFREGRGRLPAEVLAEVHAGLRGTRGGAVAVARVEPAAGRVLFTGVGNVSGFVVGPDSRSTLMSVPGIAGVQMRSPRTVEQPLPRDSALVLHSDGLTERWQPQDLPGLLGHLPVVAAGQLLREAGVRRDDAGVVVARGPW